MYEVGNFCFNLRTFVLSVQPLVWQRQRRAYGRIAGAARPSGGKKPNAHFTQQFHNAEVEDLAHGQEAIAEIARVELGYVQDGEVYYRIIDRR